MIGWCGLDWTGSGLGPVEGSYECGDEPLGSIMLGSSCMAVQLEASRVMLGSIQLIIKKNSMV
jgi:hypothetical protein